MCDPDRIFISLWHRYSHLRSYRIDHSDLVLNCWADFPDRFSLDEARDWPCSNRVNTSLYGKRGTLSKYPLWLRKLNDDEYYEREVKGFVFTFHGRATEDDVDYINWLIRTAAEKGEIDTLKQQYSLLLKKIKHLSKLKMSTRAFLGYFRTDVDRQLFGSDSEVPIADSMDAATRLLEKFDLFIRDEMTSAVKNDLIIRMTKKE